MPSVVFMPLCTLPPETPSQLGTCSPWSALRRAALRPLFSPAVWLKLLILLGVMSFKISPQLFSFILSLPAIDPYRDPLSLLVTILH